MGAEPYSERRILPAERYSIAVITLDEQMFREMREALASSFRATLASTESQIKTLIDDPDIHGIGLDLESIGDGAADGIEVLQEMRRLRDDLIMVAITASIGSELPLQASQAGTDHFFLEPDRRHRKQSCRSNWGMEIWKTLRVSHIPTPPATTTDKCLARRYTNTPLGTKDRSGQP
jgi:CheY-like chemotaxis protein